MSRFYFLILFILVLIGCTPELVNPAVEVGVLATLEVRPTIAPTETALATGAPTLVAASLVTEPYRADQFPGTGLVVVRFSQPMDENSATNPVRLVPGVTGTFAWNEDYTQLTFTPSSSLVIRRLYRVELDSGLRSRAGTFLDKTYEWQLRIAHPLNINFDVVHPAPVNQTLPTFRLHFSQFLDRDAINGALQLQPSLKYETEWTDQRLSIRLLEPLTSGQELSITLSNKQFAGTGLDLGRDYEWYYQMPALSATLQNAQPALVLQFNYALDPQSVAQSLTFHPAFPAQSSWNDDQTRLTLTPVDRWQENSQYEISWWKDLQTNNGQIIAKPNSLFWQTPALITHIQPQEEQILPDAAIQIRFSQAMNQEVIQNSLQISPATTLRLEWTENVLTISPLSGTWAENSHYELHLPAGVSTADGLTQLQNDYHLIFTTSTMPVWADFGSGYAVQAILGDGKRTVQFRTLGQIKTTVTFDLYPVSAEEWVRRYQANDQTGQGLTSVAHWQMETIPTQNASLNPQETTVPADVPTGFYLLQMSEGTHQHTLFLALSTQNLVVKRNPQNDLIVWLTDSQGQPVIDAQLLIFDAQARQIGSGSSNELGIYRYNGSESPTVPAYVVAQKGTDMSVSGLDFTWQLFGYYNATPADTLVLHTDRWLYQPGERLYFYGIARQDADGVLGLPTAGTLLTITLQKLDETNLATLVMPIDHFGSVTGQFDLPATLPNGRYRLTAQLAQTTHTVLFEVKTNNQPVLQFTLTSDHPKYEVGSPIQFTVTAQSWAGMAIANAPVTVHQYHKYEDGQYYEYLDSVQGRTDENGVWQGTVPAKDAANLLSATITYNAPLTLTTSTAISVLWVGRSLQFAPISSVQTAAQPFAVPIQVLDSIGQPFASQIVKLAVMAPANNALQQLTTQTDENGWATFEVTVPATGFYMLLATTGPKDKTAEASYEIFTYAPNLPTQNELPDLRLITAKTSYLPGETAQLFIISPLSGTALLTLERSKLYHNQLVTLTPPITVVPLPITESYAPNIFVSVQIWQRQENQLTPETEQTFADSLLFTDVRELLVVDPQKELTLTIDSAQTSYAANGTAAFTVHVTNWQGTPVSAQLWVAITDEQLLELDGGSAGTFFSDFYFPRPHNWLTHHTMQPHRYLWYFADDFGGCGGGCGGWWGKPINITAPYYTHGGTIYWAVLQTDANGVATFSTPLPNLATHWRLTASAITADTQVNQAILSFQTE